MEPKRRNLSPKQVKQKTPKMTKKQLMYVIKPYEYHKISKTTLTLIDYLYDKDLKYTDSYIKRVINIIN